MDMVVLAFIKELSLGGAEKQSLLLVRELMKKHRAFLVVWSDRVIASRYKDYISEHGLNVIFLQGGWAKKIISFKHILKREKVTHIFNFLLLNNFVGGLMGRLFSRAYIFGGIRNCEIAPSKLRWQRWLHNKISHKTIFNNHSGARKLAQLGFRQDKMLVIHNGMDGEMERSKQGARSPLMIFTAARFLPQKDHLTALKAMKMLKDRGLDFRYVMAGYGQQESVLRDWISRMDLVQEVKMVIAPENLSRLFGEAHLYLSCSLKEGLSNSIMEALSAGLPVVATDVGDNSWLVENGKNGFLVPVKAPDLLAREIERLAVDADLRRKMGQAGYQHLKRHFSSERFLEKYLKLVEHEE